MADDAVVGTVLRITHAAEQVPPACGRGTHGATLVPGSSRTKWSRMLPTAGCEHSQVPHDHEWRIRDEYKS